MSDVTREGATVPDGLRYPAPGSNPNVPRDVGYLAEDVQAALLRYAALPGCRLLWPTLSVAVPSGVTTRLQAGGATAAYWWGANSVNGNNDGIVSTPRSGRYLVAVSLQCTSASTVTWTAGFGTWDDGPTFGWGGSATGTSGQRPVFAELCYLTEGTSYCGYVYAGGAGTLQAAKLSMSYIGN